MTDSKRTTRRFHSPERPPVERDNSSRLTDGERRLLLLALSNGLVACQDSIEEKSFRSMMTKLDRAGFGVQR